MAVFRSGFVMRRRWFVGMTLLATILALLVGGVLWQSVETSSVAALQTRIDALKPVMTGFRIGLIALVAMLWPVMVSCLQRWGRIDAAQAATLHALRWRVVTWLVVIELVLGQNLLGQIMTMLLEGRA